MDQALEALYQQAAKQLADSPRHAWEGLLVESGFVPPKISPHRVTNDRFGYVRDNQWIEWNIASVKLMRYHWSNVFREQSTAVQKRLREIANAFIRTLPSPAVDCSLCGWACPESEAVFGPTSVHCSYCQSKLCQPNSHIQYACDGPYIRCGKPLGPVEALLPQFSRFSIKVSG